MARFVPSVPPHSLPSAPGGCTRAVSQYREGNDSEFYPERLTVGRRLSRLSSYSKEGMAATATTYGPGKAHRSFPRQRPPLLSPQPLSVLTGYALVYLDRGRILALPGKEDEARADFNKALELGVDRDLAERTLAQLGL